MKAKWLYLIVLLLPAIVLAADAPAVPSGKLGFPVGTYLTIEGTRAPTIEGSRVTRIKSSSFRTLAVDTVNGEKRLPAVLIEIDNIGDRELPAEGRIVIRGYETGRMVGVPGEVSKAEKGFPQQQEIWGFRTYFVLTSCVEPREFPKAEKDAPQPQGQVQNAPTANTAAVATVPVGAKKADADHEAWVRQCLADLEQIKPGMTREEVEKRVKEDGGLQGAKSPVRYVYAKCPSFKIDVDFSADGKVAKASKPYLETPFFD